MDEYALGGEVQEVAAPAEEAEQASLTDGGAAPEAAAPGETGQEAAAPAPEEKPEKPAEKPGRTAADRAFAQLRRENEEKGRQLDRLMAEYRALGFDGDSPDDAADRAEAHRTGRTAEDVRRERLAAQEREQVLAKQQAELEFFRSQAVKQKMDADLKAIQKAYPEVKSLGELGDGFLSLIRAGVAAPLAARVVKEEQAGSQAKAPAKAGKVNAKSRSEKEFYTNEELDRLTPADLDDPKVMEKALRSLTKLG